jgi:peptidoglycan/LPS O-acetylase OafA/YrhL
MAARLPALNGWRAIAALMVIASHLQAGGEINPSMLGTVVYGHLGVDYFFGISGFVIVRQWLRDGMLLQNGQQPSLRGFYIRRFFRIIPPLALYVGAILLLAAAGIVQSSAKDAWRALTFTCDLKNVDCGGWLGDHTWSLSVEEQFYLVIPLLLLTLANSKWVISLLMLLLAPVTVALFALKLTSVAQTLNFFPVIGLGVFCALNEEAIRRLAAKVPGWLAIPAFATTVVLIYLPGARWATLLGAATFAPLILFVLMLSAFSGGWLTRVLSWRPLSALGDVSYTVYLWQQLATWGFPRDSLLFHIAAVLAVVALAFASFRWFETPLTQLGRRLARRWSPRTGKTQESEALPI